MDRRDFVTIAGIGTITALAGCTSVGGTPATVEELNVEETTQNTIRVTGVGTVETEPDAVGFSVSVERSDREDASVVVEELASAAQQLRTALLEYGIPEENITTTRYSLREDSRRNVYEGEHRYSVELDDPDAVGEAIDVAVEAGADSIGRVNFTLSEARREELYDRAVQEAVDDARSEAELYTRAADQQLGEPVSMETTKTRHTPFRWDFNVAVAEASADGAATQIDAGDVAVHAEVTIEYEFAN
ncbi:MAG: SIMPL domain-containing protein [Halobacteriota archaeon]